MPLPYQRPGLSLSRANATDPDLTRALQRDLRALGYLRAGVDGAFGGGTEAAVRALQFDVLNNRGVSRGGDGQAPVAIASYNSPGLAGGGQAVTAVTGVLDQELAACMARMLGDAAMVQVPAAADPASENTKAMQAIRATVSSTAPTPFIAAMIVQESGGQHFRVPRGKDADNFVVVGLDRGNAAEPDQITSRGYGIGQYTIFHHPARPAEVQDFILDPVRNVQKAFGELREKFDGLVVNRADTADDRAVEHPHTALRLCKYTPTDPLFMRDCKACAAAAAKVDIHAGTPLHAGAATTYHADQYYPSAEYRGVPNRADFPCDWPY
jgi:peptidoglycan hydrolase-like protein with peptidoglycan-binding domain